MKNVGRELQRKRATNGCALRPPSEKHSVLKIRTLCIACSGALLLGPGATFGTLAATPSDQLQAAEQTSAVAEEIDNGLDPTIIHSRLRIENEFTDRESGASQNKTTFAGTYGFGFNGQNDWRLTLSVPVVAYNTGRTSGPGDATGLGDVELLLGHVFDPTGRFRWGLGLETRLNTATEPQLGDGRFRLSPIAGFAWLFCPQAKFQTFIQYNQSVAKDSGVTNQQELELKPALEVDLPWQGYAHVEWASKWNIEHEGDYSSKFKIEIGRAFYSRKQFVVALRYELPLTESTDQGVYYMGLTYVFK
jgi:hypothetical protein